MEGQDLLSLVKGRTYNAELRNDVAKMGIRRIGNMQWVSKATATKYEFVFSGDGDNKIVIGVDIVDQNQRIHLLDPGEELPASKQESESSRMIHPKTIQAIQHHLDVADRYFGQMDYWSEQMEMDTEEGRYLKALTGRQQIIMDDFLFLPDPLASGGFVFGTISDTKTAAVHSWLDLPDDKYIVPSEDSPEGAMTSLRSGLDFHKWESEMFDTPAAAGQYAIKALNASKTTYATAIKKMIGKENASITRNDFYRNKDNVMCRVEIERLDSGLSVREIPAARSVTDCIACLLAPYIKAVAFQEIEKKS